MNKPFFSTKETQLPTMLHHLGHIIEANAPDALEEFGLFMNAVAKEMWGERPRKFAKEHFKEDVAYGRVITWLEKQFWR